MSVRMGRFTALGSAALVVAGAGVMLASAPAHAHNTLVSTLPAAGAVVPKPPTVVELVFNEPVLGIGSAVKVTGPDGDVAEGKPGVVDERVRQPLRPGPAGKYTVSWRVTSADGHPISDSYTFTARAASTPVPSDTAALPVTVDDGKSSPGEDTSWTQILVGGALGAAIGTGYVVFRRRRAKDPS